MKIIGIDYATKERFIGLSLLDYDKSILLEVTTGNPKRKSIEVITEWINKCNDKFLICIDSPLGWPESFKKQLSNHMTGNPIKIPKDSFFLRETDKIIHKELGKKPLEVTANFIARTAFSALNFLDEISKEIGNDIKLVWKLDAVYDNGVIETYPAGWLESEGIKSMGYKKNPDRIREIFSYIEKNSSIDLSIIRKRELSDHELDSLICCLVGKEFLDGKCIDPFKFGITIPLLTGEGWIWFKPKNKKK